MLGAGITTWDSLADNSYIGSSANNNANWPDVYNGAYDDAQWLILSLWKMADYKNAHGEDATPFMVSHSRCLRYEMLWLTGCWN
jgi:hypothetical protein